MKIAAIILLILTIVMGGALLYMVINTRLHVTLLGAAMTPAKDQPREFARWMDLMHTGALQGTVFDASAAGAMEDHGFLVYTIKLENKGLLPAEMAEVQLSPIQGDVLSVSGQVAMGQDINEPLTVPPGGEATLQLILLTQKDSHAVRDLTITYYIWGKPYTIQRTYG